MGSKLFKQFIKKSLAKQMRGSGPPGPPPRQGLQWKPQTHRWIRPQGGETSGDKLSFGTEGDRDPYSAEAVEQKRPEMQRVMNERLGQWINEGRAGLEDYDISEGMSMFDKVHNEVMLGDYPGHEGGSVLEEAGINIDFPWDLDRADEQHLYDFMDEITTSAMEQHGLENEQPDDASSEDSDPEYDYDFFQSNVEEEGLMGKIPDSLNSYKSDWENRDASARPEWGSDEWNNEVGELTFDIGFAMPEDDADLTRAESDISDAIKNSGVEGFENFGTGGEGASPDSGESVVNYNDFVINAVGLVERIPKLLQSFKNDWDAQDPSERSEWGGPEWQDDVNEITYEAGFAMPEGGENEDADLDRASEWLSARIREAGDHGAPEGFENYGL